MDFCEFIGVTGLEPENPRREPNDPSSLRTLPGSSAIRKEKQYSSSISLKDLCVHPRRLNIMTTDPKQINPCNQKLIFTGRFNCKRPSAARHVQETAEQTQLESCMAWYGMLLSSKPSTIFQRDMWSQIKYAMSLTTAHHFWGLSWRATCRQVNSHTAVSAKKVKRSWYVFVCVCNFFSGGQCWWHFWHPLRVELP